MSLEKYLNIFINDPYNPDYNFRLGYEYEKLGHTSAAIGYYIRTAEFGHRDLLSYEALLRMSICFSKQGMRNFTVKGILLRAITLLPERPEAYFLLSRAYEKYKEWQESYCFAIQGEELIKRNNNKEYQKLITDVEYPGSYGFPFERAVSAWWIGLYSESLSIFRKLKKDPNIDINHKEAINNNLNNLSDTYQIPIEYNNSMYERFKYKFVGLENVINNYSQCFQDLFVLLILNGKRYGKFLEIGCGDPYFGNNTALLESIFSWSGISIDNNIDVINKFRKHRNGNIICGDALKIDYNNILKENYYDYLQIDCDPSNISLDVLLKIPFDKVNFGIVTFEHDDYLDESGTIKHRSREYLKSLGYKIVIPDVSFNNLNSFEDWWIHEDIIKYNKLEDEKFTDINMVSKYLFNN